MRLRVREALQAHESESCWAERCKSEPNPILVKEINSSEEVLPFCFPKGRREEEV